MITKRLLASLSVVLQRSATSCAGTEARRATTPSRRISEETWGRCKLKLVEGWSPEQTCSRFKPEGLPWASHESLYQRISADKQTGGSLHQFLRCQKPRRERYGSYQPRGNIANRRSIDERPAIVQRRGGYEDWEADLIIGAAQREAVLTIKERKSQFSLMAHVSDKSAEKVSEAMSSLLKPFKDHVHTITTDNGSEFAYHRRISRRLRAECFFAHPYASWQRGSIENHNGLVR